MVGALRGGGGPSIVGDSGCVIVITAPGGLLATPSAGQRSIVSSGGTIVLGVFVVEGLKKWVVCGFGVFLPNKVHFNRG